MAWWETGAADVVPVRFLRSWQAPGGARYQAGEVIGLSAELAPLAMVAGVAVLEAVTPEAHPAEEDASAAADDEVEEASPVAPTNKALDRPPKDKWIRRAPRKKGGRWHAK